MRSWSTRRWRKGSPRFSARCPPGPDAVCRYLLTPDPNPRDPMIQTTKVAHRTVNRNFAYGVVRDDGSRLRSRRRRDARPVMEGARTSHRRPPVLASGFRRGHLQGVRCRVCRARIDLGGGGLALPLATADG